MPHGTKPLHEPTLTQIYVAIWHHSTTTSEPLKCWIHFRKHSDIYFHFLSSLNNEMAQVIDIPPSRRQRSVYPTYSIPWLLMNWQRREPGHQQPWNWPTHGKSFKTLPDQGWILTWFCCEHGHTTEFSSPSNFLSINVQGLLNSICSPLKSSPRTF